MSEVSDPKEIREVEKHPIPELRVDKIRSNSFRSLRDIAWNHQDLIAKVLQKEGFEGLVLVVNEIQVEAYSLYEKKIKRGILSTPQENWCEAERSINYR